MLGTAGDVEVGLGDILIQMIRRFSMEAGIWAASPGTQK